MAVSVGAALGYVEPVGGGELRPAVYLWAVHPQDLDRLLLIAAQMAPTWLIPGKVRDGHLVRVEFIQVRPATWRVVAQRKERTQVRWETADGQHTVVGVSEHTHDILLSGVPPAEMMWWQKDVRRLGLLLVVLAEPAGHGQSWSVPGYDTMVPREGRVPSSV